MNNIKVCKFGGTSMATRESVDRVIDIINADENRKYVVVSAPGKRHGNDVKVTDLLYETVSERMATGRCDASFGKIRERFLALREDFDVDFDVGAELDEIEKNILDGASADYAASRGEYLSAKILAAKTGWKFVDAKDIVKFKNTGAFDAEYTNDTVRKVLSDVEGIAVIPGFYGATDDGEIFTFSRGGSDITGAVVARGTNAALYENWTDVDGFLTADPRIVENPEKIRVLTYAELRELSYMGANVLHPEATFPLKYTKTPINIKNTFNPDAEGTMIVANYDARHENRLVTGIAGHKGFTSINISKSMMNSELGFGRRVLSVLEYEGVSFEHIPSGIDTLSVFVADGEIMGKMERIVEKLREAVNPDSIEIHSGMSLIATVGLGMSEKPGTAARLFGALAAADVNIRMIDQGSSEMNIIVGVESSNYERAINAVYEEFFKK